MTSQDFYNPVVRTVRYISLPRGPRSSLFTASTIQVGWMTMGSGLIPSSGSPNPRYRPLHLRRPAPLRSARSMENSVCHANPIPELSCTVKPRQLGGSFKTFGESEQARLPEATFAHDHLNARRLPPWLQYANPEVCNPAHESLAPDPAYFIPPALSAGPTLPLLSYMTPWALGGLSAPIIVIMFDTGDCIGSNIQFLASSFATSSSRSLPFRHCESSPRAWVFPNKADLK
ncbi:hypothetical protein BKA70DRAFT_1253158, partial [Coprinopsis sp. MPI-PUGE-AT-0042]